MQNQAGLYGSEQRSFLNAINRRRYLIQLIRHILFRVQIAVSSTPWFFESGACDTYLLEFYGAEFNAVNFAREIDNNQIAMSLFRNRPKELNNNRPKRH